MTESGGPGRGALALTWAVLMGLETAGLPTVPRALESLPFLSPRARSLGPAHQDDQHHRDKDGHPCPECIPTVPTFLERLTC